MGDCVVNETAWNKSRRNKERKEETDLDDKSIKDNVGLVDNYDKDKVNEKGFDDVRNDETSESNNVSYANMVKKDEVPKNLNYIPIMVTDIGSEVVIFDEMLVKKGSKRWCLTIYGQFVGYAMNIHELRYNIRIMWGKFGVTEIHAFKNGHYVFKFRDNKGLNVVLDKGPWMKLHVWVKMVNVPLEAWSINGISALASRLGKPLMMDTMTTNMCYKGVGNLEYARVLVEMDAEKHFKKEIEIQYRDQNNNIKGSKKSNDGNHVMRNKWNVKDKEVDELRTANKYFVLESLLEDNDQEPRMLKERMIVDKFLHKKVQPTLIESMSWSKDMIRYFKEN
uniref:DUF4283 domain-containing protein n=1 Tax=Tanacetum cinerariifolium TaxID=118510 RepID=A0A6L2J430_TANCI|nr:hypothetical protein [Tanacetum cinerariifolium]